jgi:aminoglycoside phosphotransferase family enzyme/predicted kinase
MNDLAAVPVPAAPARLVETHTSVVTMIGDRVYKLKKQVDLGFLDFRTLDARLEACRNEVALNRRLAPDVYLGVAEVIDSAGTCCDALVVMRRMPDDRRLADLVMRGEAVEAALADVARLLADFHARCETSPEITSLGSRDALRGLWDEGLAQLAPLAERFLVPGAVHEIDARIGRFFDGRLALFCERQRLGMVRDGHGDLQADDIFCLDDGPRILDCLEFDRRLRVGDVLADAAFLAMDLERLGAPASARVFLDEYATRSGERHPMALEHIYVAYRAFVRCKVACLRAAQGSDPGAEEQARQLGDLTLRHLRAARVRLVLVGGLPGAGKTTLSRGLTTGTAGWALLRSDVIRKELAGVPAVTGAAAAFGEGLYSSENSDATYVEMLSRARGLLRLGTSVVLDASWSRADWRRAAAELAAGTSSDLIELRCEVPPPEALHRLAQRASDASDATPATLAPMTAAFEAWPAAHPVPTGGGRDEALALAVTLVA